MKLTLNNADYKEAIKAIAADYGVTASVLAKGVKVEFEHGKEAGELDITHDDILTTAKIALVHLKEDPNYYDKLEGVENADEHWITTETGSHILIDGEGNVKGGAGGALDGKKLDKAKSKKSLSTDYKSRMDRAKEMGFSDPKYGIRPYYHGTTGNIKEFDLDKAHEGNFGKGVYLTRMEDKAAGYAGKEGVIMPLLARIKKPFILGGENNTIYEKLVSEHGKTGALKKLQDEGYDALKSSGETVVFDPKNIRSVHAMFDPSKEESKDILNTELTNAKQYAGRFFCKHMRSGIAGGYEGNEKLFINEDGIKALSPTFEGKPVYVGHQEVSLEKLQQEADGYVVRSFYNEKDGWWWAEFMAVSDAAHEAIRNGCGVSNAYVPTEYAEGDQHIGVDYDARVINGYFTHLAIVPNPRYEESIILTPEQFREYQDKRTVELKNINNSKTTKGVNIMSVFGKIFKREEVTNSLPADADYSKYDVDVDGKMVKLSEIINAVKNMDKEEEKEEKLNADTKVKVGDKETTLGELINRFKKGKKNSDDSDEDDVENDDDSDEDDKEEKENKKAKKNSDAEGYKGMQEAKEKKNSHFDDLRNADKTFVVENSMEALEGQAERLARAKKLMSI